MDFINLAILQLLDLIKGMTGTYALAIVVLTVGMRIVLWPLNTAQTRSMKKTQELQPKLKQLQERHKDDPRKLQEAMMKFYQEHKFNPFGGCLPMLVQIPIFIGLYGALNSPDFLAQAGNEQFLFIDKLYHTLKTHAGDPMDGTFSVKPGDKFQTGKSAKILFKVGGAPVEQHVKNTTKALEVTPQPLIPGDTIKFTLNLAEFGVSSDYAERVESITVPVVDENSRELESVTFTPQAGGRLSQEIKSVPGVTQMNMDVLILILIYAVIMVLYQQVMQRGAPAQTDPMQAQMMKLMPLMFIGFLFFVPIPAGVLLYLVITMVMMFVQTWWVHWDDDRKSGEKQKPSEQVIDIKPSP